MTRSICFTRPENSTKVSSLAQAFRLAGIRSARFFVFAVMLLLASGSNYAQSVQYTQNKADLALRSAMRVDPTTLGLNIDVPIASYPGRGGTSSPVTLSLTLPSNGGLNSLNHT